MNINEILKSDYDLLCKDYKKAIKKIGDIDKEKNDLQQENNYYFKKNNELSSLNTSLRSDRDDYKSRIDKAIDYIHNHQLVFQYATINEIQDWFDIFYKELLDILKGGENEKSNNT